MTDIASLGIVVTTDGITQSAAELDKLDAAGQRAAASQGTLAAASKVGEQQAIRSIQSQKDLNDALTIYKRSLADTAEQMKLLSSASTLGATSLDASKLSTADQALGLYKKSLGETSAEMTALAQANGLNGAIVDPIKLAAANSALTKYQETLAKIALYTEGTAVAVVGPTQLAASNTALAEYQASLASLEEETTAAVAETTAAVSAGAAATTQAADVSIADQVRQADAYKSTAAIAEESNAAQAAASKATIAAQTAQMQAYTTARAPVLELQSILQRSKLTTEDVARAESLLDTAQASGIITTGELAEAFAALDVAKIVDVKATKEQTAANVEGAAVAKGLNSRTAYSLSALITDAATGQFSRSRREVAALANETGVMSKVFTVAAIPILAVVAAVGAFAVAAFKGSEEANAYSKALLLTGNYAGQTTDSLATMATALSGYGTTQHEAAAGLAAVAQSGKFTATQIELVGQAALKMSKVTGQSTQETIKQFESLQRSPLKAVEALDDAQHFLTTTIYEQIKALEDEGRTQDAADLASQTYAQHIADVATKSQQNLGLIEKSWNGIKGATLAAIDAAMSFGRAQEGVDKFNALSKQRDDLTMLQKGGVKFSYAGGTRLPIQQAIDDYTKQLSAMQDAEEVARKEANKKSLDSQSTEAVEQEDKEASLYDTRQQKRVKETLAAYNKSNADIEKAMAVGDTASAERIAQDYVKINEGIAAKYKDRVKRPAHAKADPLAPLEGLTNSAISENLAGATQNDPEAALLKQQVTQLQAIAKAAGEAITKHADLAKVQAIVATATQNVNEHFKAESDQLAQKNADAVARYKASLDDMLATRKQQIALQAQSLGQSALETQHQKELLSLQEDYNKKRASLVKQEQDTTSALDKAGYAQQITDLDGYYKDMVTATKEGWEANAAAQADGIGGMKRAIGDFINDEKDLNKESYKFTQSFISGFGNAFTSFIDGTENAKTAFGGFIDSMYKQAVAFMADQAIKALFQSFMPPAEGGTGGGFSSLLGNFLGGLGLGGGMSSVQQSSLTSGSNDFIDSVLNADGNVYNSPSLSAYSGQVVSHPTAFAFANGMGIMGEAGDEGILPLARTAAGKLGVQTVGSASPSGTTVNQTIVVSGLVNRQTQQQVAQKTLQRQRMATARN